MSKTYDASFEEWYKRMFNKNFNKNTDSLTKTDTMSDEDFEVGTNLYNAYLQKNNLLDQYNKAQTSLEQERTQSQQQASIQLDKLKKYIPTQIKAQGLGGLGVSESTLLKANSEYQNKMGQIASDVGARQMDLLKSYNSGVLDIDTKLQNANTTTLNKYQEIARKAQDDAFNGALIDINGSSINNEEEMLKFLEGYRGLVSEEQFKNLEQSAKNQVNNNQNAIREQQKGIVDNHYQEMLLDTEYTTEDGKLTEDGKNKLKDYLNQNKDILGEELYNSYILDLDNRPLYSNEDKIADENKVKQAERDKLIKEGKEYFNYGGSTYKVKKQLNAKSNEIAHNNDFKEQLKNMGFADAYNPNIPNGTTLKIKCDSSGANEVNWKDFAMDFSDWRNWIPGYNIYNQVNNWAEFDTRYVTYYDGQWYLSEKK